MKAAMRVLIVEDDPMVMRLNVDYLARLEGVELVGQCESVPAALEVLEREAVDLLLLDVYLRNRSGLEVLRHLRAQDRNTDAVLITAASEIETVRAAQRLGARDYLVKPFSFERFRDAVEACRRARSEEHPSELQSRMSNSYAVFCLKKTTPP